MSKSGIKEKEKTIPVMLKNIFRRIPKPAQSAYPYMQYEEFTITSDIIKDISSESPLNQRIRVLRELNETVLSKRLEDNAVEALWQASSDLLNPSVPKEYRHVMLTFVKNLIQGQYEKLGITRGKFFSFIQQHTVPEDFNLRFDILKVLTDNGKDVVYFEEEMGPFMLVWMPEVLNSHKANEFLVLIENVIKFNSAYLDQEVLESLISNTCVYTCCTNMEENIVKCLSLLDVFVCYSCLPPESLNSLIFTLCRTVNVEKFCLNSWKLMRNLLGTHLGHSAICTLCNILQDKKNAEDFSLLRGAVFFLSMGLWGSTRVSSLQHPPLSVLPSFIQCLQHKDTYVALEVGYAVQRLVQKNGADQNLMTWDLIMDILNELFQLSEVCKSPLLASIVIETLTSIEELYEASHFRGSIERLFIIFEKCSTKLPERSIHQLINYKAQAISPMKALWLTNLNCLVERFFKNEKRTTIRVKTLEILASIIENNKQVYEEDMIDKIVLPLLKNIENESDVIVCDVAVQLLVTVARDCTSKRCLDILEIIQKVINKPLEQTNKVDDVLNILHENELSPLHTAASGLVQIFKVKLFQLPSIHAIQAFQILTSHIQAHYSDPVIIHNNRIRIEILKCFLQLRCSVLNQIGIMDDDGKTSFSPYLLCAISDKNTLGTASPPVSSPTLLPKTLCTVAYLSPVKSFQAIITALKKDTDWEVLKLCLDQLPNLLQNQTLILSGENVAGNLCSTLCAMLGDRNLGLPETLRNVPNNFSRADFHSYVLPVLAALVSYHKHLDNSLQRRLVKCLEFGFVTKCARICIIALALCILEMRDTMYKLLPEVLLSLSKISATIGISIPILEFLSSLIRLPKLYASFVEDQYMSIFAISLPYINPFKFNHYTVALAYHVIAMWFLKCRLPFRRDFVKFIIQGLQSNVLIPLEEEENFGFHASLEEISSRRRACSMNEQALSYRKRERINFFSASSLPHTELRSVFNQQMKDLNLELTETFIDLMARYTFAACSALPKRFPASKFLLEGGQSMTWLLGTKLITVTTSGCSSKILKQGLCNKCFSLCKGEKGKFGEGSREFLESNPMRRRHRSAIQRSVTEEIHNDQPRTKDDLQLQKTSFSEFRTNDPSDASLISQAKTQTNDPKTLGLGTNMGSQELETQNLDKLLFALKDSSSSSSSDSSSHPHLCNCWCQGWAEILVRRPTGNVSWMMRVQNQPHLLVSTSDFPLADITTLLLPSHQSSDGTNVDAYELIANHRRIDSESLEETEYEKIFQEHFDLGKISDLPKDCEKEIEKNSLSENKNLLQASEFPTNDSKVNSMIFLKTPPVGKLTESKPPLRRTSSSPDVLLSSKVNIENVDEVRKERVNSDAAVAKIARRRMERRAMLKSDDGSFKSQMKELTDSEISFNKLTITRTEKDSEKNIDGTALSPNKKTHESPSLKQEQNADSPDTEKENIMTLKKPIHSSLRQQMSVHEEHDDVVSDNIAGRLLRRGSERAVHFDLKTKSPPHSPVLSKLDSASSSFRDRGHTISTANPAYRNRSRESEQKKGSRDLHRSGINPSFVFLQLYQDSCFGNKNEIPLLLPKNEVFERALKCFDRIPPYETHKIGVVYVGKGQVNNEADILGNAYGSSRYVDFLQGLGQLICLQEINPQTTYIGGLDQTGEDGKFAYIWQDDVMQVIFHVSSLMPTKKSDQNCVSKKKHIGNDYVTIVYNDSGEEFNIQTIKGQFMYACVVIHPLDHDSNLVTIKTKPVLEGLIGHSSPKIISNQNLPILARQLALHANLASMIFQSQNSSSCNPYASNWLERLRDLKRMRKKLMEDIEQRHKESSIVEQPNFLFQHCKYDHIQDFTEYV